VVAVSLIVTKTRLIPSHGPVPIARILKKQSDMVTVSVDQ
jgi:hypothetical protein